jgi:metallophosphoesterase superfamily enzyme
MGALSSRQLIVAIIARNVLLDGRLALFHTRQRWLAVADLHFGYELSQRAAGNLFPLWGMQTIEARLLELLGDYKPAALLLLGDLVHDAAGATAFFSLVARLRQHCAIMLIAGNHDREIKLPTGRVRPTGGHQASNIKSSNVDLVESWRSDGFYFHHGDCAVELPDCIQVSGHHHPVGAVRDGAGLRLKLPALVQRRNCWIMPAFSPWAAGTEWPPDGQSRVWLCSPQRILRVDPQ